MHLAVCVLFAFVAAASAAYHPLDKHLGHLLDLHPGIKHKEPGPENKETIIYCTSGHSLYMKDSHRCNGYMQKDQYGYRVFRRRCPRGTYWAQPICGCVPGRCGKETIKYCTHNPLYARDPDHCDGYLQKDAYGYQMFKKSCPPNTKWAQKICSCVWGHCGPRGHPHIVKVFHKSFKKLHKGHKGKGY